MLNSSFLRTRTALILLLVVAEAVFPISPYVIWAADRAADSYTPNTELIQNIELSETALDSGVETVYLETAHESAAPSLQSTPNTDPQRVPVAKVIHHRSLFAPSDIVNADHSLGELEKFTWKNHSGSEQPCLIVEFGGEFTIDTENPVKFEIMRYGTGNDLGHHEDGKLDALISDTEITCDDLENGVGNGATLVISSSTSAATDPAKKVFHFEVTSPSYIGSTIRYFAVREPVLVGESHTEVITNNSKIFSIVGIGLFKADIPNDTRAGTQDCENSCAGANPGNNVEAIGEPIEPSSGNYTYMSEDLSLEGLSRPLAFQRMYSLTRTSWNSQFTNTVPQPFPAGWTHNFNAYITGLLYGDLYLHTRDGARHVYKVERTGPFLTGIINEIYPASDGFLGVLTLINASDPVCLINGFKLSLPNGEEQCFGTDGRLKSIVLQPGLQPITLSYNANKLDSVTSENTSLTFTYNNNHGYIVSVQEMIADTAIATVSYTYAIQSLSIHGQTISSRVLKKYKDSNDEEWLYTYDSQPSFLSQHTDGNPSSVGSNLSVSLQGSIKSSGTLPSNHKCIVYQIADILSFPYYGHHSEMAIEVDLRDVGGVFGGGANEARYWVSDSTFSCSSDSGWAQIENTMPAGEGDGDHVRVIQTPEMNRPIRYIRVDYNGDAFNIASVLIRGGIFGNPTAPSYQPANDGNPVYVANWLTAVIAPDGKFAEHQTFYADQFDMHTWGRVKEQFNGHQLPSGLYQKTLSFTYSETPNITEVTDGEGNVTEYLYNDDWSLNEIRVYHQGSTTQFDVIRRNVVYGRGFRVTEEQDGRGGLTITRWSPDERYIIGTDEYVSGTSPNDIWRVTSLTRDDTRPSNVLIETVGYREGDSYRGHRLETRYEYNDSSFPTLPTAITRVTDLNTGAGLRTTMAYTETGHVSIIVAGLDTTLASPSGIQTNYYYEDAAHPNRVTRVINNRVGVSEAYDPAFPDRNLRTDFVYDNHGRVIETKEIRGAQSRVQQLTYDPTGLVTKLIQNLQDGQYTTGLTDQDLITLFSYDGYGNLTSMTDPLGHITRYKYDGDHRLIQTITNDKPSATGSTDQNIQTQVIAYNSAGNPTITRDIALYDPANPTVESNGVRTYTCYDHQQRPIRIVQNATGNYPNLCGANYIRPNSVPADEKLITTLTYNVDGTIATVTDPNGIITAYTGYNGLDLPTEIVVNFDLSSLPSSEQRIENIQYDPLGNVVVRFVKDGNGTVYTSEGRCYDTLNRVTKIITNFDLIGSPCDSNYDNEISPDRNLVSTITYDAWDRVISTRDIRGRVSQTQYDGVGRPVLSISNYVDGLFNPNEPDVDVITGWVYDPFGRVEQIREVTGANPSDVRITRMEYDLADRTTAITQNWIEDPLPLPNVTNNDISDVNVRSTTTYDALGRVTSETDPLGLVTTYSYDDLGRVVETTLPGNRTWFNDYDILGRLVTSTDPLTRKTTRVYDDMNRLISETQPDNLITQMAYDAGGRITSMTNPQAIVTKYAYNGLGQLINTVENAVSSTILINDPVNPYRNVSTQYTYDVIGNLRSVTLPTGVTLNFAYDMLNRQISRTAPAASGNPLDDRVWLTEYSRDFQTVIEHQPGGVRTVVSLDALNRTDTVNYPDSTTPGVDFDYDALGRRSKMVDGTGTTLFQYDALGRPIQVNTNSQLNTQMNYTYNLGGQRQSMTMIRDNQTRQVGYQYDPQGRLQTVTGWTDGVNPAAQVTYGYDALDRLQNTALTHNGISYTQTRDYDPAGNLAGITVTDNVGGIPLQLDYTYNALGNRTSEHSVLRNVLTEPLPTPTPTLIPTITLTPSITYTPSATRTPISHNTPINNFTPTGVLEVVSTVSKGQGKDEKPLELPTVPPVDSLSLENLNRQAPDWHESVTRSVGSDLLVNGGFETSGTESSGAQGWTGLSLLSTDLRVCSATAASEGSCGFRFRNDTVTQSEDRRIRQIYNPAAAFGNAGDSLEFGYDLSVVELTGATVVRSLVRVQYTDTNLLNDEFTFIQPTTTNGFINVDQVYPIDAPVDQVTIILFVDIPGKGRVLVDEAYLRLNQVDPTATPMPSNTPVPPTATLTPSSTPVPPTITLTPSSTPVPPTITFTPSNTTVPATVTFTPTSTPVPPTATFTPIPPTLDATLTPSATLEVSLTPTPASTSTEDPLRNRIYNPDFELGEGTNRAPLGWTSSNITSPNGLDCRQLEPAHNGECVVRFSGTNITSSVKQTLATVPAVGDVVTISGWIATGFPYYPLGSITLNLTYTDGTSESLDALLPTVGSSGDYLQVVNSITITKPVATAEIVAQYESTNDQVITRIDDLSVIYVSPGSPTLTPTITLTPSLTLTPSHTPTPSNTPTPTPTPLPTTAVEYYTTYAYDNLERLTQAKYYVGASAQGTPQTVYDYTYDLLSNRTSATMNHNGQITNQLWTYNAASQVTENTNIVAGVPTSSYNFAYDPRGNLLTDGRATYGYDSANRLTAWTNGTASASFAYNGFGDRVSQTTDSQTTQYQLDLTAGLTQVVGEFAPGDDTWYLLGLDLIAQDSSASGWSYPQTDALGSVRSVMGGANQALYATNYDPYGNPRPAVGGLTPSTFGFTGQQTDASGLQYLRARYYSPALGSFLTPDPVLGVAGGPASTFNPYSYVRGNTINLTDPSGLIAPLLIGLGILAVVGIANTLAAGISNLIDQLNNNGHDWSQVNWCKVGRAAGESLLGYLEGLATAVTGLADLAGMIFNRQDWSSAAVHRTVANFFGLGDAYDQLQSSHYYRTGRDVGSVTAALYGLYNAGKTLLNLWDEAAYNFGKTSRYFGDGGLGVMSSSATAAAVAGKTSGLWGGTLGTINAFSSMGNDGSSMPKHPNIRDGNYGVASSFDSLDGYTVAEADEFLRSLNPEKIKKGPNYTEYRWADGSHVFVGTKSNGVTYLDRMPWVDPSTGARPKGFRIAPNGELARPHTFPEEILMP